MKNLLTLFIAVLIAGLAGCSTESIEPGKHCSYVGIIEDHSGLDGCGYLIKLSNGEYLEPAWRWGWCGTPPFPEGYEEDPLRIFQFADGKQVKIGFEYAEDQASICMKGRKAYILCIEEVGEFPEYNHLNL